MKRTVSQYDDNFRIGLKGKVYHGNRLITFYFEKGIFKAVSTFIKAKGYEFIQIEQSPNSSVFDVGEKYVFEQFGN
ncbi:hypothetical protein [Flagellimonas profundi]|uniref:Uncharacterized protein n=1 Tax=Flagellimonas profundi TaxID=2915620 RepID=A0ABS3FCQ6_9FLAO|nr:hypothetical protein [Allomuricauda profundi]MBO0340938.1 hypothetical protein [Allomuricauda profundi]